MTDTQITFHDGAGYERYMGIWSQFAGAAFLDWLSPSSGLRWLDVGCGNGAFTEMIALRCAPESVEGIDPSEAQLSFARARIALRRATFRAGDAMLLPQDDNLFDIAVMPLVIFFVPNPFQGVAEMARVVRPGGLVTAYGWDLTGGGFPYAAVQEGMKALGVPVKETPSPDAARFDRLKEFWTAAGLTGIQTHEINVQRTFPSADDFWTIAQQGPSLSAGLCSMTPGQFSELKSFVAARLPADSAGRLTVHARAHAIQGRVA